MFPNSSSSMFHFPRSASHALVVARAPHGRMAAVSVRGCFSSRLFQFEAVSVRGCFSSRLFQFEARLRRARLLQEEDLQLLQLVPLPVSPIVPVPPHAPPAPPSPGLSSYASVPRVTRFVLCFEPQLPGSLTKPAMPCVATGQTCAPYPIVSD